MQGLHDLPAQCRDRVGPEPVIRVPRGRWAPTHRHRKGGLYRRLGEAVLEADHSPVVIYDDIEGQVWVRDKAGFEDGRFTPVTAPRKGLLARLAGLLTRR